jgi:hypothetical protein
MDIRSPRVSGIKGTAIWICESSLIIYTNTSRVFESVPFLTGLKDLVILYSTSSLSSVERISNVPCLELGEVNVPTYEVWLLNISSTTSSWRKSLSFNSSAVRRLLILVESPGDYLISAAAPFGGGYLVSGDGTATFSIGSTLTFRSEVHLIPFATAAASHTLTRSITPCAMPTATAPTTPGATLLVTLPMTPTATRNRAPDSDSQTPLPLRTRSESATRTSAVPVPSKDQSQAMQSPVPIATLSPSSVGIATETPILDSTQSHGSGTTRSRSREPVPTAIPIWIDGMSKNSVSLHPGQQLVMRISAVPLFVVLPVISNLSAAVYDSDNKQTDSFAAPTSVLAVYFSRSIGHLIFTATAATALEYFSILPLWECSIYYLSTSPFETWSATQTGGNFTIDNSQNICLLHISDNVTIVSGNYNVEMGFDSLYYQYSSGSNYYTGAGIIAATSNYFTSFCWSSDATDPSKSI